ncbi:MAG: glycosyltransferase family protein [Nitrospina sp.]|jgi:spore coat polysaccharide biosynthesis protein SpsF|nr:glycosyltransferase family protein [Nitrospina sp.]MBT6600746.1 glycosyltransferase family protein [Nitrospina sp.]
MIAAVVQARMNSTRCPGKSLYPLAGIPLTEHIINRIKAVTDFDHIVLAIPNSSNEMPLVELAQRLNIMTARGSEEDVLERFLIAADQIKAQHIVRICGDNPLFDRQLMRLLIRSHLKENSDYTITCDSIPLGTGTEVVKVEALKRVADTATEVKYREHVTTWFHDNPTAITQSRVPAPIYLTNKHHRLTIDTKLDLALMEKIFNEFYTSTSPIPNLEKVIQFLDTHPDVAKINAAIPQKNWRS